MKNFFKNIPAKKNGPIGLWAVGDHTPYRYKLFDEYSNLDGVSHSKTFRNEEEAPIELFNALADGAPQGALTYIKGIVDGEVRYGDAIECNVLAAGQTRSGKTNNAQVYILSLMHFAHPEYLKIVIFDPKTAAFKALSKVVNVVNDYNDIVSWLHKLVQILRNRIKLTGQKDYPSDAKKVNEYAYKYRRKSMVMPYICVVFDEFADFVQRAEKEDKQAVDDLQTLASMGLGLGIQLKLLTQAPYARYINGFVKNNFEGRIAFNLGDYVQEQLVLGFRNNEMDGATRLRQGEFLSREKGSRVKYTALYCGSAAAEKAANNLRANGFNYQLESPT